MNQLEPKGIITRQGMEFLPPIFSAKRYNELWRADRLNRAKLAAIYTARGRKDAAKDALSYSEKKRLKPLFSVLGFKVYPPFVTGSRYLKLWNAYTNGEGAVQNPSSVV